MILVENADGVETLDDLRAWREDSKHLAMRKRKSGNPRTRRIEGARLATACATMEKRYGVRFEFCRPEEAAARVVQILLRGCGRGNDA